MVFLRIIDLSNQILWIMEAADGEGRRSEKNVTILAHEDKGLVGKFCAGDFMPEEEKCAKVLRELR